MIYIHVIEVRYEERNDLLLIASEAENYNAESQGRYTRVPSGTSYEQLQFLAEEGLRGKTLDAANRAIQDCKDRIKDRNPGFGHVDDTHWPAGMTYLRYVRRFPVEKETCSPDVNPWYVD